MSATAIAANFDYSDFDPDSKGKLISLAGQIKKAHAKYKLSLFEVGEVLAHAHGVLSKHKQGTFTKWIEAETGIENTTAYNYMYAWMRFHGFPNHDLISAGAMYKLAAPKAPPAAAKEAEKLANKGERVTEPMAAELIKKHKEPPANSPTLGNSEAKAGKGVAKTEHPAAPPASPVTAKIETPKGNCPRGGDHEPDEDGDCKKCKEPKAADTSFDTSAMKPPKNGSVKPGFADKSVDEAHRLLACGLDELYEKITGLYDNRYDLLGGNRNAFAKAKAKAANSLSRSHDAANDALKAWKEWRDG